MSGVIDNLLVHLKFAHEAVGFPLVVAGLALMLFGWRLWKISVVLSFGAIGAMGMARYVGPGDYQFYYALAGGLLLGLAAVWPVNIAVALLGGLIGAGVLTAALSNLGLSEGALWCVGAAALIGCTAFAFTNRQRIVIVVTSFMGAALLLSGIAVWAMTVPSLYGSFQSMASYSGIVLPFVLLVPTVMAAFYQLAEVRRLHVEL